MKYQVRESGETRWPQTIEANCSEDAMQKVQFILREKTAPTDYVGEWVPGDDLPTVEIEVWNVDDDADDPTGTIVHRQAVQIGTQA